MKLVNAALLLAAAPALAEPVAEHRFWMETYDVSGGSPHLEVSNIWGSVQVRAGQPGRITVAVTELRTAPDSALFERSLERIGLNIETGASGVSILVGNPIDRRGSIGDCRGCRVDYQFEIQVPAGTKVDVGTVMDGKIDIRGVAGPISASNVNGPINIDGMQNCTAIDSVNGPIGIGLAGTPVQDCGIETINGDVTFRVPADISVDIALDLFNGEVSSELPVDAFAPPASVEHVAGDGRTQYRIQQLAGMRIGAGGPVYTVASVNGDLRIGKK
ncbi:MAG: hypothetical protein ACREQ1_16485 [Woeseiaceae bacterium]